MDSSPEAQTKPLYSMSVFSYIPPRRNETKQMSYFNKDSEAPEVTMYDQVFHQAEGYDVRLHRDDRNHWKGRGLHVHNEEKSRTVPVLSSSVYGQRSVPNVYRTDRQHSRVACIKAEFFMKNGIIWNVAEGYGSVAPI
ncbi:cilia- and flagella-associated protein 90 [Embiotoca jacksoni]|uniref:cilia- and flagella-associated protein 90 n=1 Tax=Embiotoca jacksoni TaxID=100190 RepID=UPI0037039511